MSPITRRLTSYGLLALSLAIGTLLSPSVLAKIPRMPKSESRNASPSPANGPQFSATSIPLTTGVPRWPAGVAVDKILGTAYLADGDRGTVTLVAGVTWLKTIPVGQEVTSVAVDAGMGLAYATAPDPFALYEGHIAVIRGTEVITQLAAGGYPGLAAVDPLHNRVYVAVRTSSLYSDLVIVLQRDRPIAFVNAAFDTVALDVDAERGRAYVLNRAGSRLSIISGTPPESDVVVLEGLDSAQDVAADPTSGLVYALGRSGSPSTGTILIISGTEQIGQLPAGSDPKHIAVNPQRGWAYVSNAGDNSVTVISGTQVIDTIPVGLAPDAIAVDAVRDRVYVSNAGDGTTTVLSGRSVVTTLPAGGGPLAVDSENSVAYLAGDGLGVAQNDQLVGRLRLADMPACIGVNPSTGLAYVCNQGTDTVSVLSDKSILTRLALAGTPRDVEVDPLSGWVYVAQDAGLTLVRESAIEATLPITAHDVAVDPVRGFVYAVGDDVAVISGTERLGLIDLGQSPRNVAVNRATGLAYATAGGAEDGFVAIISGTEHIGNVEVGGAPGKLAIDPVRDRVYVLHPEQGRISVIEGTERHFPSILLTRSPFGPPLDAAVNPLTGELYVATEGSLGLLPQLDEAMIDLGLKALAVDFDVKRGVAYATTRDGQVAVLDGEEVVAMVPAGHRPVDLAIDDENGQVFVANYGSDTVTVVERGGAYHVYLPAIMR